MDILYPNNSLTHSFSSGSSIPIVSDVEYSGVVGLSAVFVNRSLLLTWKNLEEALVECTAPVDIHTYLMGSMWGVFPPIGCLWFRRTSTSYQH